MWRRAYIIALENAATGNAYAAVSLVADAASLVCSAFTYATTLGVKGPYRFTATESACGALILTWVEDDLIRNKIG